MRSLVFTCSEDLATLLAPLEAGIPVELRVQPKSKELRSHDILLGNNEGSQNCVVLRPQRKSKRTWPLHAITFTPTTEFAAACQVDASDTLVLRSYNKDAMRGQLHFGRCDGGSRNLLLGMAFPQALDPALEKVAQSIAVPKVVVTLPKVVLGDRGRLRNPSFAFEVWLKKHAEQCASIITKVSGKNKKKEKFYVYKNVVGQSYTYRTASMLLEKVEKRIARSFSEDLEQRPEEYPALEQLADKHFYPV